MALSTAVLRRVPCTVGACAPSYPNTLTLTWAGARLLRQLKLQRQDLAEQLVARRGRQRARRDAQRRPLRLQVALRPPCRARRLILRAGLSGAGLLVSLRT